MPTSLPPLVLAIATNPIVDGKCAHLKRHRHDVDCRVEQIRLKLGLQIDSIFPENGHFGVVVCVCGDGGGDDDDDDDGDRLPLLDCVRLPRDDVQTDEVNGKLERNREQRIGVENIWQRSLL